MTLLNSVINWINFKRNYQIQLYREHPVDIQMETLLELIRRARETTWGEKYNFGKKPLNNFKSLATRACDDIRPWVDRLRNGNQLLL